jgi:hypothetical protein
VRLFRVFKFTLRFALYRASPANDAEQYRNDGNDQQRVNNTTRNEAPKEAYSPDDNKNYGDDIQEVAHGFEGN